ncbi:protein mono-ADP-ribosyltransferase PARP11-like [Scleropages formosus]|uniref:protein mono-ADP-ribosyltransferase PARP11-like n=1 Tax=Scleropages formosus TaxID=113540 RepID=UPI00087859B3|nr:protein mono-ADP-ribosyltransferase PARP11-like [Scleropages formosus]
MSIHCNKVGSSDHISDVEAMDTSDSPWCWFYLAECGTWHMFKNDAACSLSSEEVEWAYGRNPRGCMEFSTATCCFKLDFSAMVQINCITGKQQPIRRSFQTSKGFWYKCNDSTTNIPPYWETMNADEVFQAVPLYRDTFEYQEIRRLFERTMDAPIKTIHRIQNLDLWEFFCRKKAQLKKLNRALNIEEKKLFHGTDHENVHPICKYNFDLRLSGMHGRVYGKGIYFARDAKYSSKYCQTTWNTSLTTSSVGSSTSWKTVFLARVLVGEYTLGERDICRPPSKDSTSFYDSCVDDVANPKIFVIFDSSQIYPEYVIEF